MIQFDLRIFFRWVGEPSRTIIYQKFMEKDPTRIRTGNPNIHQPTIFAGVKGTTICWVYSSSWTTEQLGFGRLESWGYLFSREELGIPWVRSDVYPPLKIHMEPQKVEGWFRWCSGFQLGDFFVPNVNFPVRVCCCFFGGRGWILSTTSTTTTPVLPPSYVGISRIISFDEPWNVGIPRNCNKKKVFSLGLCCRRSSDVLSLR